MTERQPYKVVNRHGEVELRRYPAYLVAEIKADGSFDEAPDRAFRPLARFINGANRSRPPDREDGAGDPAGRRPRKRSQ